MCVVAAPTIATVKEEPSAPNTSPNSPKDATKPSPPLPPPAAALVAKKEASQAEVGEGESAAAGALSPAPPRPSVTEEGQQQHQQQQQQRKEERVDEQREDEEAEEIGGNGGVDDGRSALHQRLERLSAQLQRPLVASRDTPAPAPVAVAAGETPHVLAAAVPGQRLPRRSPDRLQDFPFMQAERRFDHRVYGAVVGAGAAGGGSGASNDYDYDDTSSSDEGDERGELSPDSPHILLKVPSLHVHALNGLAARESASPADSGSGSGGSGLAVAMAPPKGKAAQPGGRGSRLITAATSAKDLVVVEEGHRRSISEVSDEWNLVGRTPPGTSTTGTINSSPLDAPPAKPRRPGPPPPPPAPPPKLLQANHTHNHTHQHTHTKASTHTAPRSHMHPSKKEMRRSIMRLVEHNRGNEEARMAQHGQHQPAKAPGRRKPVGGPGSSFLRRDSSQESIEGGMGVRRGPREKHQQQQQQQQRVPSPSGEDFTLVGGGGGLQTMHLYGVPGGPPPPHFYPPPAAADVMQPYQPHPVHIPLLPGHFPYPITHHPHPHPPYDLSHLSPVPEGDNETSRNNTPAIASNQQHTRPPPVEAHPLLMQHHQQQHHLHGASHVVLPSPDGGIPSPLAAMGAMGGGGGRGGTGGMATPVPRPDESSHGQGRGVRERRRAVGGVLWQQQQQQRGRGAG
ncbi:unnamed protein product [Vitrella brassicaformis CCMP3155]|uniref:Uncharacterized protein n=1 Tax=Vitrella brassicaformis (strain CCMP3155) TaxID=1169540 RepID=A0A0G4GXH0_VITBC|nr:unnamed protein product [Vitrella brassicaformis CCMP3155]|eukprot:CEM35740.1 unnamed protein product [Vitrella brassicaformis CCMP3155]